MWRLVPPQDEGGIVVRWIRRIGRDLKVSQERWKMEDYTNCRAPQWHPAIPQISIQKRTPLAFAVV